MDPLRMVFYALLGGVVTLIMLGAGAATLGYMGGQWFAPKQKPSAMQRAADNALQLREADLPAADNGAIVESIKALAAQVARLEAAAPVSAGGGGDNAVRDELVTLRRTLAASGEEASSLRQQLAALETRAKTAETNAATAVAAVRPASGDLPAGQSAPGTIFLTDQVLLKRDQSKSYTEAALDISLQGVAARSARVAVNRKAFAVSFGERRMFREGNAVCEMMLTETDISTDQARLALTCKR